ncbi:MAG: YihY/virulence factor BrkB family protein [Novosphingobium sp.]
MEERQLETAAGHHDLSPEARRLAAIEARAGRDRLPRRAGLAKRTIEVMRRVWTGAYYDGFIHAGNLAYMAILALFPFFIVVAGVFSLLGESSQREASLRAFLRAVPPMVAQVIEPVARDVMAARSGWLLAAGCFIGLWTVTSLIETVRDILHRAYGTPATHAFWRYRLLSSGIVVVAVVLLLLSLFLQVAITAAQEVIALRFPRLEAWLGTLTTSRLISGVVLYGSIFALFLSLTPSTYRSGRYPKWPGALLVTVWWIMVTVALPSVLRLFFSYSLTYGSLAGVMIALFFFWLVGLGMVAGAELNAALAETPEERDALGRADNRAQKRNGQSRESSE